MEEEAPDLMVNDSVMFVLLPARLQMLVLVVVVAELEAVVALVNALFQTVNRTRFRFREVRAIVSQHRLVPLFTYNVVHLVLVWRYDC